MSTVNHRGASLPWRFLWSVFLLSLVGLFPLEGIAQSDRRLSGDEQSRKSVHRHRPQLAISAAFDPKGDLWVVGLAADHRALELRRVVRNGQVTQENSRRLHLHGDAVSADGENRPKLVYGEPWVVITYTQPLARPYTGEIRMMRSGDGGSNFSAPYTVHQDRQVITHRFESVIQDTRGVLHTFWIDKRDQEQLRRERNLTHKELGRYYRGAAIYRNESRDGGQSFGPDTKVADYSCECCRIALALDSGGLPVAMWRHVFEPNIRDHAFWSPRIGTIARASFDGWQLDACPHHGPALVALRDGGFHAVWFGEKEGVAAVRHGRLDARGNPFGKPQQIADRTAEHADIAALDSALVISWRGFDGQHSYWKVAISRDEGASFQERLLGKSEQDSDYPILVSRPGRGIWGLWNKAEGLQVEKID